MAVSVVDSLVELLHFVTDRVHCHVTVVREGIVPAGVGERKRIVKSEKIKFSPLLITRSHTDKHTRELFITHTHTHTHTHTEEAGGLCRLSSPNARSPSKATQTQWPRERSAHTEGGGRHRQELTRHSVSTLGEEGRWKEEEGVEEQIVGESRRIYV